MNSLVLLTDDRLPGVKREGQSCQDDVLVDVANKAWSF